MTLTVDQKIRMLIGEYVIQITALQAENEQLKAQLAGKADAASSQEFGKPVDNGGATPV